MYYNDHIPNCVPEYYRELQEREEHEYEILHSRYAYYEESSQKLCEAYDKKYPVLSFGGFVECRKCKNKFDAMRDAEDDFDLVICYGEECYNKLFKIYGGQP